MSCSLGTRRLDASKLANSGAVIQTDCGPTRDTVQLEDATAKFDEECKKTDKLDWSRLSSLAWKICDLTQLLDFETRKLYRDQAGPVTGSLQYMLRYVESARCVLENAETQPKEEDLFKLRIACSHVERRIPSFRECLELQSSALDRMSLRPPGHVKPR